MQSEDDLNYDVYYNEYDDDVYTEYEDIDYKVIRCGVIPYHKINNNHIILLMGFKRNYNKYYGDFGGGIGKNEYYINGLIRELTEESNGIFGNEEVFVRNMLNRDDTIEIEYITKSKTPSIYLEYLVNVKPYDFPTWFEEGGYNNEHKYVKWIDVVKINNHFTFKNITLNQIDGSIKPLVPEILSALETV